MLKFLWQYILLIQIKINLVCVYYPYLQHPLIFKSRAATGLGTKQKSAKYTLKSRNQILIRHACGRGLRYLAF